MRKPVVVLGVVAGLLGAQGLAAQVAAEMAAEVAADESEAPPRVNSLEPGARALSFSTRGTGNSSFGYTRFRSDERSITWEVDVRAAFQQRETSAAEETTTEVTFEVGPTFRRYFETEHKVVPFFNHRYFAGYSYRRARTEVDDRPERPRADGHGVSLGAGAAVGLEWFPVRQMSLRGETGLRSAFVFASGRQKNGSFEYSDHTWIASLGTYTAGLTASIYLPRRGR